jgi:hypothetical protein
VSLPKWEGSGQTSRFCSEMQFKSGAFDYTAAHHMARDAARAAAFAFRFLVENQSSG